MKNNLLKWSIYEITSEHPLNGVMLRGRIRKLGIENDFNVLTENTSDIENGVRFAVLEEAHLKLVENYLKSIVEDVSIKLIERSVENPVLSKMKVNRIERYKL